MVGADGGGHVVVGAGGGGHVGVGTRGIRSSTAVRQWDTSASGRMEPSGSLPGDGASRPAGGALRSSSGIREGCGHWGRGQWENFLKLFFLLSSCVTSSRLH